MFAINDIECIKEIDRMDMGGEWNYGDVSELIMHRVHSYPAKFPSFIASKSFDYAQREGVDVKAVADIFCGCGTVALEARVHRKDFWGCDINPVATLIAKVKSSSYNAKRFEDYYNSIISYYNNSEPSKESGYKYANDRIKHWYTEKSFNDLTKIKQSIIAVVPAGKYRNAFLCIFSSILKNTSKWLTKSIKPQIDSQKKPVDAKEVFKRQTEKFVCAIKELNNTVYDSNVIIENGNFLMLNKYPEVDLIITSPPYVTSYEYADLHQLSTLWLDYTSDYRTLRQGTIGSAYNTELINVDDELLNDIAKKIIDNQLKNVVECLEMVGWLFLSLVIQNIKECKSIIHIT